MRALLAVPLFLAGLLGLAAAPAGRFRVSWGDRAAEHSEHLICYREGSTEALKCYALEPFLAYYVPKLCALGDTEEPASEPESQKETRL